MRREQERAARRTIRVAEFVRSFHIGGTEGQALELLRGLPPDTEPRIAVTHEAGPLMEEVWSLGHLPEVFSFHGSVKKPNTVLQIARLTHWLRRERVDLVHAHDFYVTMLAVPAAKLAGVKVLVGRLDLAHFHTTAQRRALVACTRAADHVVANAEAIRQMLVLEEAIPESKITVIRNGIDVGRFDQRRRGPLEAALPDVGAAPVLVHVANMTHPVKRQEDLLQALAILVSNGSPVHAFLVGDGERRPEIEALAVRLGVSKRAHFLGLRTDVPAILARATLGVLCSSAEGLSNAVAEGMAAGLPMVVTRVGGNLDLISDGERGFLVPPYAPEALAEAVARVLANPAQARWMGAAGRAFVERELTLQQLCERHDALYRAILDGAAAAGASRTPCVQTR
jgi:glycosyltransferase involved in cell wall biosynthesis